MSIVTRPADVSPGMWLTDTTSPTSTPAIRTGEGMCSCVWVVNTALSTNGDPENGSAPPKIR